MQHGPALTRHGGAGGFEHAVDIVVRHGLAADRHLGAVVLRRQAAARDVDDDGSDLDAGHALGRVDGETDRVLRLFHVHHGAALDAARALVADAEDAAPVGAAGQGVGSLGRVQLGDQAGDLGRADVEHAQDARCGGPTGGACAGASGGCS